VKNPAWTGKSSCEVVGGMTVSPLSSSRKGREELVSPEEEEESLVDLTGRLVVSVVVRTTGTQDMVRDHTSS
jgi:hypothetical protein